MSLIARMAGIPEPGEDEARKLGFNQVLSFVAEVDGGFISANLAYSYLELSPSEQAEFNNFVTLYGAKGNQNNKRSYIDGLQIIFNMAELRVDGSPGTDYTDLASITARINQL